MSYIIRLLTDGLEHRGWGGRRPERAAGLGVAMATFRSVVCALAPEGRMSETVETFSGRPQTLQRETKVSTVMYFHTWPPTHVLRVKTNPLPVASSQSLTVCPSLYLPTSIAATVGCRKKWILDARIHSHIQHIFVVHLFWAKPPSP